MPTSFDADEPISYNTPSLSIRNTCNGEIAWRYGSPANRAAVAVQHGHLAAVEYAVGIVRQLIGAVIISISTAHD